VTEEKEEYLGDGLFVSVEGGMIRLRTPRGYSDHLIYLEPEVLDNFLKYVEALKAKK
jgi:hypothetical protein